MKKFLLIISALVLLCALWLLSKPTMSEIGIAYAKPAEAGQALTVTWFGVTTLLIDDGVTGFLVNNVDEAVNAISRIGEIDRAACRAAVSERFSVDRMADRYLDLYRSLLG